MLTAIAVTGNDPNAKRKAYSASVDEVRIILSPARTLPSGTRARGKSIELYESSEDLLSPYRVLNTRKSTVQQIIAHSGHVE